MSIAFHNTNYENNDVVFLSYGLFLICFVIFLQNDDI